MNEWWWKVRYAWHMGRTVGKWWPIDVRFYWRSAVASWGAQDDFDERWTPDEAVFEDISNWY